jgi:hypothetical protein
MVLKLGPSTSLALMITFPPVTGFAQLEARGVTIASLIATLTPGGPSRISTSGVAINNDLQAVDM